MLKTKIREKFEKIWPRFVEGVAFGNFVSRRVSMKMKTKLWKCKTSKKKKRKKQRPVGLEALLENQLDHWPKFQKLHIYSLSTPGVEIELIFALRAGVSEIRADFQNWYIWAWSMAIGQSSRNCNTLPLSPKGSKLSLSSLEYGKWFPR